MLAAPSRFTNFKDFLKFLIPALNATVGFWATVSPEYPDFTRFARSQREQIIGQGAGAADDDDPLRFHWHRRYIRHRRDYGTAISDPVKLLRAVSILPWPW